MKNYTTQIKRVCDEDDVQYLALFGSYAREDQTSDSDIDLLVKFKNTKDLIEIYQTEEKLSQLFKKKVDLVTTSGLSKHIKPYIENDLVVLYDEKS